VRAHDRAQPCAGGRRFAELTDVAQRDEERVADDVLGLVATDEPRARAQRRTNRGPSANRARLVDAGRGQKVRSNFYACQ
jgi:hypothetical protein